MSWKFGLLWLAIIWGAAVASLSLIALVQERGLRRTAVWSAWVGAACLGAALLGALVLMSVGLI